MEHLDQVVYRPIHGPNNPKGQLNLAVREDSLKAPDGGFFALARNAANAFAIHKTWDAYS
jgi:hypothetical protein